MPLRACRTTYWRSSLRPPSNYSRSAVCAKCHVDRAEAAEVIYLAALPLLEGAAETVAAGIVSSLQPANVRLRRALRNQPEALHHPNYPLLFDPQTAGGLLASVPAEQAADCIAALRGLGYTRAICIGRVLPASEAVEPITLRT